MGSSPSNKSPSPTDPSAALQVMYNKLGEYADKLEKDQDKLLRQLMYHKCQLNSPDPQTPQIKIERFVDFYRSNMGSEDQVGADLELLSRQYLWVKKKFSHDRDDAGELTRQLETKELDMEERHEGWVIFMNEIVLACQRKCRIRGMEVEYLQDIVLSFTAAEVSPEILGLQCLGGQGTMGQLRTREL